MRKKAHTLIASIVVVCLIITVLAVHFRLRNEGGKNLTLKAEAETERLRTIVTTDGECDDLNSFVRFLYYSNDMDIRGIVLTSSCFHYAGDASAGIEPLRWAGTDWPEEYYTAYEKVYDNLKSHDPAYPSPDDLRGMTAIGNVDNVSEMEKVTEGSELIRREILLDDPKTLYLQCWGGTNTVARALKSIEEEMNSLPDWETKKKEISSRLVLFMITVQDDTYESYIKDNWPEITVVRSEKGLEALAFSWKNFLSSRQKKTMKADWQIPNILHKENPLASLYFAHLDGRLYVGEDDLYQYGKTDFSFSRFFYKLFQRGGIFRYGDFLSEGDSPAFLFLVGPGKRGMDAVTEGNWGGRFVQKGEHYYIDEAPARDTVGCYITEMNEDFAERIIWSEQDVH